MNESVSSLQKMLWYNISETRVLICYYGGTDIMGTQGFVEDLLIRRGDHVAVHGPTINIGMVNLF